MPEVSVLVVGRDGSRYADLPAANIKSLTWTFNDAADGSFGIHPKADGLDKLKLVGREVQVWFDDQLVWWGVPWGIEGGSSEITIQMKTLESLMFKRFVDRTSLIYGDATTDPVSTVDQFTIGWGLVEYAQDESVQANRDLNIGSAAFTPSGIGRTAQYKRDEHKNILDLLKEFPKMFQGFDWDIQVTGDGSRFWTPYYPRKGQLREAFEIEWDEEGQRGNTSFGYREDGLNVCTDAWVTGGSSGGEKIEEHYEDVTASAEFGVMQAIISEGTTLDRQKLGDRARQETVDRAAPTKMPSIQHARTKDLDMLGVLEPGDWIPVEIDCGIIQIHENYRVKTITWDNSDTLKLEFGEIVSDE